MSTRIKITVCVALLIAIALVLVPYKMQFMDWRYDPAGYPSLVKWAGCHATVIADPSQPAVGSFYIPMRHVIIIGTDENAKEPYYAGLFIVLHETGHCLQDESGWLDKQTDIVVVELDADRRATDLACARGLDGRKILHDTFVWARDEFGYQGDPAHGSLEQRMAQGDLAHACDKVTGQ
jgi:hypothetical protein